MKRTGIASRSRLAFALLIALTCCGCAGTFPFISRDKLADDVAFNANLTKAYIQTPNFTLTTYCRFNSPQKPLRVYIEGDGQAWESKRRLSADPTPTQPIALQLAALDTYDNVAYIARPGQYSAPNSTICDPTYWSQKRFAPEVVDSINQVIDRLKKDANVSGIELIGYSGGGALVVLIASKRTDVLNIRTVAGNLDHEALCEYHEASSLTGSLNPIDVAQKVAKIPQYHFVGDKDKVVPPFVAEKFFRASGCADTIHIIYINNASHTKGWVECWPRLLGSYPNK